MAIKLKNILLILIFVQTAPQINIVDSKLKVTYDSKVFSSQIDFSNEMYDNVFLYENNERINYMNQKIINWMKRNVSPKTNLPYSFYILKEKKNSVYTEMGPSNSVPSIIERVIVEEGLVIYDGSVWQIALINEGGEENLNLASKLVEVYWKGSLKYLHNLRAGFPVNQFIYDKNDPEAVSSDLSNEGKRGFIFRIIDANGDYNTNDPLDGKSKFDEFPTWPTIHWEDWKPVAGENAWVVMAALHLYHKKFYDKDNQEYFHDYDSIEVKLAQEISRAALFLQSESGGIRMSPLGTFRKLECKEREKYNLGAWWYNQISSENNISWYSAFRMLYEITGNSIYKEAMDKIETYFKNIWNKEEHYFCQGMSFVNGKWNSSNFNFALDVQTWGILCFGPEKIDEWLGEGTAYKIWQTSKKLSGAYNSKGELIGVGYTKEHDRVSVEWTAGAVMAVRELASFYKDSHPDWVEELDTDADNMIKGMELLRVDIKEDEAAYSYSSKRAWIPFGWYSHNPDVLSLASTGWIYFVNNKINPFYLP